MGLRSRFFASTYDRFSKKSEEAGLVWVVLSGHVSAPESEPLLQSQRVQGASAGCNHAVGLAGLPEGVPQM